MANALSVLLVHDQALHMAQLGLLLEQAGVDIRLARSYSNVSRELSADWLPDAVFTDALMQDGDWRDVLSLARQAGRDLNVVVVCHSDYGRLYFRAVGQGSCR